MIAFLFDGFNFLSNLRTTTGGIDSLVVNGVSPVDFGVSGSNRERRRRAVDWSLSDTDI